MIFLWHGRGLGYTVNEQANRDCYMYDKRRIISESKVWRNILCEFNLYIDQLLASASVTKESNI